MTTMTQPMQALELGNRIRLKRVAIKRDVRAGRASVVDLLENHPPELDNMVVAELLRAMVRWGPSRVRGLFRTHALSETRTFSQMTDRQKAILADALRRKGVR